MNSPVIADRKIKLALGDVIVATVRNPYKALLSARLDTPAAFTFGEQLVNDPASGWQPEPASAGALPAITRN